MESLALVTPHFNPVGNLQPISFSFTGYIMSTSLTAWRAKPK